MQSNLPFFKNAPSAFTLVELLTVMGILGVLITLLIPALARVREAGKKAVCISNLRQVGIAIHSYAADNEGRIPYGPKAPPFTSPADFYPSTGAPTSLVSMRDGAPVGMGLLLRGPLARQAKVLLCPGGDQPLNLDAEAARMGVGQVQSSYYYRHAGVTRLFDDPVDLPTPEHLQLDNLGHNRNGKLIRALAIDTLFLCPPDLAAYNVVPRTHHKRKVANILFSDGHSSSQKNEGGRFEVDLRDYAQVRNAFDKILQVLERADSNP